jgi:hypothetical protein
MPGCSSGSRPCTRYPRAYGARRVHAELTLGLGIQVGHNAVEMLMRRSDEWLHVGTLHRTGTGVDLQRQHPGGEQQAVRDLLVAAGHGAVRDEDLRVDLICARDDQLKSWLAVHVRKTPSPVRQKKKPRRPNGAGHGG